MPLFFNRRNLMEGLGKLLDDETRREPTVVRIEDDAEGRDKTMTPAFGGERGRSRTVTVLRNGEPYQDIGKR